MSNISAKSLAMFKTYVSLLSVVTRAYRASGRALRIEEAAVLVEQIVLRHAAETAASVKKPRSEDT